MSQSETFSAWESSTEGFFSLKPPNSFVAQLGEDVPDHFGSSLKASHIQPFKQKSTFHHSYEILDTGFANYFICFEIM